METHLRRFVADANADLALLMQPSGRVLSQVGFTRAVDVMSACALVAAINATSAELGRVLNGVPFNGLHHASARRQSFVMAAETRAGTYVLLTVFGGESSFGIVRLYADELRDALTAHAPQPGGQGPALTMDSFERDLDQSLAQLFGTAS